MTTEDLGTPDMDVSATDEAPTEGAASEPFDAPDSETNDADSDADDGAVRYKKASLIERLQAWWEGDEVEPEVDDEPEESESEEPEPEEDDGKRPYTERDNSQWSSQRAEAAELVWGEGFIGPSGSKQILEMVKPMGLDPSMSVLDLSAGLGGGARLVAQTFGVWVTGMESSENLTELANVASEKAGMSKKAPIENCNLENLDLDDRSFDCIYARELFFTVKRKSDLFHTLNGALKTDAELAFTDFVLAGRDKKTDAIKKWIESEPVTPYPWSAEEAMDILNELNLDVRVNQNITDIYRALVVEGLETIVNHVKKGGRVSAEVAPAMLEEAELWGRRVEAFDSGDLKVYRFLARKPDMGQKGIVSMSG